MRWLRAIAAVPLFLALAGNNSCSQGADANRRESEQQQKLQQESVSAVGMPAITNFREKRLLKQILEQRDHDGLVTFTYLFSEVSGKVIFFCDSIGYPIPYATQFTSPQLDSFYTSSSAAHIAMPQADPNGLYSPASADGTWIVCKDPAGKDVRVVYVEPKVIASPFKLKTD
jgi:hypothetical protein